MSTRKKAKAIVVGYTNHLASKISKTVKEDTFFSLRRLEICQKCEYLSSTKRCTKCGCWVPAKTKVPDANCPENKW